MPSFVKYAAEIYRDYVVDGVPSTGPHKPIKADIRAWMQTVEGFAALAKLTTAQRDAIGSPAEGDMIFNLDTNSFDGFDGTVWGPIGYPALTNSLIHAAFGGL